MSLQDDDGLGSIRFVPDAFSELPPSAGKSRRIIGIIAAAAAVMVGIAALKLSMHKSIIPLNMEMMPSPGVKNVIARNSQRRKLRNPSTPLVRFPIVKVEAAEIEIHDEDFVIGVELAGAARAYPINMMGKPESELLNDTLAGRPIAVTFCSTCQSPLVFSRQVEGQTLTFFLNGELLSNNMIMKDSETGSEWVQLTGEAIEGPLKGRSLEELPAIWTDWRTWWERHPDTTAPELPRVVENYQHHPLYSTFPPERSFFSALQWGLARGDKARSWPYAQLARQPIVNDAFAGQPLLVLFDQRSSTPTAFQRSPEDTELTFHQRGDGLTDDQTGSLWDPITGRALEGPLKGHRLRPVPGTISLNWAWRNFYPDTEMWSAPRVENQ